MRDLSSRFWLAAVTAMMGCVPGTSPIRINDIFPIDTGSMGDECNLDAKVAVTRGRLDASGGGDLLVVLSVDSELSVAPAVINTNNIRLDTDGKHTFVMEALTVTYKSTNPVIQFETEQLPISGVLKASSADNRIGVDIIGDKAADKLRTQLTDTTQVTQLSVTMTLKGHLTSGESVTSNPVVFPVEVTTSNAACPEPGNVTRTGPCGVRGGQGGSSFACCTGPGAPVGCP
ncbi:MAG: hypothetical protein IPJ65_17610 [Archangiaceae bacterium]|nr:hypothetical protein [Archangiaceae bacterium]